MDEKLTRVEINDGIRRTRLSEQPIHKYRGACCRSSRRKKSGSSDSIRAAQARLFSFRCFNASLIVRSDKLEDRGDPPAGERPSAGQPTLNSESVRAPTNLMRANSP